MPEIRSVTGSVFGTLNRRAYAAPLAIVVCLAGSVRGEDALLPTEKDVRAAAVKSIKLLESSRSEYLKHRDCFTCHHQAVPSLALTIAQSRGIEIDGENLKKQLGQTSNHLTKGRKNYEGGKGQGGQVDTAGYALWTLEMGAWKADDVTAAVVEYLLLRDKDQDHWRTVSKRPPSEVSHFTTTYLALRGLLHFGSPEQKVRAKERVAAARSWLLKTTPKETEDRVFRLWGLKVAGADEQALRTAAEDLLVEQRPDGGWRQLDGMESDAYATGTVLTALEQAAMLKSTDPAYRRGVGFLVKNQLEDGSWHVRSRSKPFQTYFESGFPHGKDQFISVAASGWATAALVLSLPAITEAKRP